MRILRHKTALRRTELSLPVKCLLRDVLIDQASVFFDYGCGHGEDIRQLTQQGFQATGWDPTHRPESPRATADVVNLGYVFNVIENPDERAETLRAAWRLCRKILVVSAQIVMNGRGSAVVPYGDGVVTRIGTFQKFFMQEELRNYLEGTLGQEVVAAAPGVFYAFRDDDAREAFLATRYRRTGAAPKKRLSEKRFEEHRKLLDPFMSCIAAHGRLPTEYEYAEAPSIIAVFGSLKRAFALIRRVTGDEGWELIRQRKTEDITVYLALAKFRRRSPMSALPISLREDIREFFGSYTKACAAADALLFRAGDASAIDDECGRSTIGKVLPEALYIHCSAISHLAPLLRIYEGCAKAFIGDVPDATLVKLHRHSGKVSYLAYPDFDDDPHPALLRGVKVSLRSREVHCYDYSEATNPPILHRKETFVSPEYPLHERFARLTVQEERYKLLEDSATIGTHTGWQQRLAERGVALRGHRVIKAKKPIEERSFETDA
jgi:DNA phosphorothioation-associated putative methyltransferase